MRGIAAILGALLLLTFHETALLPDAALHAHVLDVGQGDAILLVSPSGKQILIDGGPDLSVLEELGRHMPFFDRTIELLILTHPDSDHVTGIPEILSRYRVERVLFNGTSHESRRYEAVLAALKAQGIPVILPDPSLDIDIGDGLTLDILWPEHAVVGTEPEKPNDESVVVRALFGSSALLLTGDIGEEAEMAILASGADIRSSVLKVPHHGSRTSSSTGFLLAADPGLAVISVGKGNPFGHPHPDVTDRYEKQKIPLRITAEEGTVSLYFPPSLP